MLRFGKYETTLQPGPHFRFPRPIENVIRVNIDQIRAFPVNATMLTRDENIVEVEISAQYQVANPRDFVLNVRNPQLSIENALDSALRGVLVLLAEEVVEGRCEHGRDFLRVQLREQVACGVRIGVAG